MRFPLVIALIGLGACDRHRPILQDLACRYDYSKVSASEAPFSAQDYELGGTWDLIAVWPDGESVAAALVVDLARDHALKGLPAEGSSCQSTDWRVDAGVAITTADGVVDVGWQEPVDPTRFDGVSSDNVTGPAMDAILERADIHADPEPVLLRVGAQFAPASARFIASGAMNDSGFVDYDLDDYVVEMHAP